MNRQLCGFAALLLATAPVAAQTSPPMTYAPVQVQVAPPPVPPTPGPTFRGAIPVLSIYGQLNTAGAGYTNQTYGLMLSTPLPLW